MHNHKKSIIYKHKTILLHVSTYNGHLQEGGYQRKEWLRLITLDVCRYKAKMHRVNKLHDKI